MICQGVRPRLWRINTHHCIWWFRKWSRQKGFSAVPPSRATACLTPFTAEGLLQLFTHKILNSWLFARGKVLRPGFDWSSGRWHLAASRVTFPELPSQNYLRRGLRLRLHWLQLWPCDGWWLPGSWPLCPPLCACSWTFNQFHTISAGFLQEEPHLLLIYPVTPGPQ